MVKYLYMLSISYVCTYIYITHDNNNNYATCRIGKKY